MVISLPSLFSRSYRTMEGIYIFFVLFFSDVTVSPPVGQPHSVFGVCACLARVCLLPVFANYLPRRDSGSLESMFDNVRAKQSGSRIIALICWGWGSGVWTIVISKWLSYFFAQWPKLGSIPRLLACQSGALNNWATVPRTFYKHQAFFIKEYYIFRITPSFISHLIAFFC